jgi:RHS repeat-associated protein
VNLIYDALGREVEITSGSTHTQVLYSPIGKLGLMNGQVASTIRIPLPGGSTAELLGASGGTIHILHSDWLGSARLSTTYGNRTMAYDRAYAPYGEAYPSSSNSDLSFTGQSQDTLSGMFDFLYREYNPVQGRWISPDPSGLGTVDPSNPQSWNRYAYVLNNPLALLDRFGLDDDCGGPCQPFSYTDGACNVDVSYSKQTTQDGNTYDIPMFDVSCPPPPRSSTSTPSAPANHGGVVNWLTQKVNKFCSAYPDVTQVGAGFDMGFLITGGAQFTVNANGNSGETSLSLAWVLNEGFVGPDAYVLGGAVKNAPTNASLNGFSVAGNLALSKTGISANRNSVQVTVGPSVLPWTASVQVSDNQNLVTVPYAGYVMNEVKGACTGLFGNHK